MTAPVVDITLGREHLLALRRELRRQPGIRLHTYGDPADGSHTSVLRVTEPASEAHPAGVWELSAPDPTMLRVWWMPNATVGDESPEGSLLAVTYAARQHPARFAAAAVEAIADARSQRGHKVWRPPVGM